MEMKKQTLAFTTVLFILFTTLQSFIITRDDVSDSKFIALGEKYSDIICHFPMGEGTLIDSCWVITAGHVAKDLQRDLKNGMQTKVKINGKEYDIENIFVNPDFQPVINDIALIKLRSKVISKRYVSLYNETNEIDKLITVIGMGDVGTGKTGPQKWDKITRAATNKIDGTDQNWIWFRFDEPGAANVTDMEGISGPGDSGGPALIEKDSKLYIVGISSNQKTGDHKKGTYGVTEYYTRVSTYYNWLLATMKTPPVYNLVVEKSIPDETAPDEKLRSYAGSYGFRKIIVKGKEIYFQRENEPLILMKEIGKDLFLWDDNSTKIQFIRDNKSIINGFEIHRKNGEIIKVVKDK